MFSCATTLLEAKNISHSFDYLLFNNVNLSLHRSKSIAILGVSGSGKSTLLHILSSFIVPKKGSINIDGDDILSLDQKRLEALRKNDIGIIFQRHYLFRGFSALDNLNVASIISGKKIDPDLIEALGIKKVLNQNALDISGGEQQRVSVARVLTKKPKIIFADEPTGNLDKITAQNVMDVIFSYVIDQDKGMFLVTHDEKLANRCDNIFLLEDKQLRQIK